MEILGKLLESFYNCVCCETKVKYPDPYTFSFGKDEHREVNSLAFQPNEIKTTKYNLLNFIPKSMLIQYKRLANVYFLFVATLVSIPAISPLNPALIWLGVFSVLIVAMVKQGYQDYSRHKIDVEINNLKKTKVIRNHSLVEIPWGSIVVGDICLIEENQFFPADLVLLSTCQDDGIAYIQTASLDGEKTSKIRYAFQHLTSTFKTQEDLKKMEGVFFGQLPDPSLQSFKATLKIGENRFDIVDNKQLLFRGSKLMNTEKIWGIVAYTGQISKIMLNSQNYSNKISVVEKRVNYMLLGLFFIQMALCAVMGAMSVKISSQLKSTGTYLDWSQVSQYSTTEEYVINFLMFFIDLSTILPISLFVTVELVKLAQSYFIDFDKLMYSDSKERGVLAKNTVLNEELGQIQYVFTDKTGTLTSNKMTFHSAVIGNCRYEFQPSADSETYTSASYFKKMESQNFSYLPQALQLESQDKKKRIVLKVEEELIHHYLMALLACNTVNVVVRDEKRIYESESPDQIALIKFIRSLGYVFVRREQNSIHVEINGKPLIIRLLEKFSFSSERKRMSVIVQVNSQIWLYTKGADNVITERILPTSFSLDNNISQLSKKGLRTLMVAIKPISEEEIKELKTELLLSELKERDELLGKFAQKFEKNLTAIGATALLDQLQSGVPETLRDFQRADIHVWMLTGDKLETAIQVAKSCNLIGRGYTIIESRQGSQPIEESFTKWEAIIQENPKNKHSLVIEGSKLGEIIRNDKLAMKFAKLSEKLTTVICCRLLPIQKAQTVNLIKQNLGKVCLAIGDGGNDVSMLRAADVGVGLYGEEGMSAVQASDYAIPEFRMIWRLMFVHGRWNYLRISELVLYFTYKSILFTMPRLVFSYYSAFSGQPIYDDYYIALYNVLFTSVPLLVRALFEQDANYVLREEKTQEKVDQNSRVSEVNDALATHEVKYLPKGYKIDSLLKWKFPKIYYVGKNHEFFNLGTCVLWTLQSAILGVCGTFLVLHLVGTQSISSGGYTSDLWMCSITIYSIIIVLGSVKIFMQVQHMTALFLFSLIGCSLIPYLIYVWISNYALSQYVEGTVIMCFKSYTTYFVVLFISLIAIIFISVVIYITFHKNPMIKKILLKMENNQGKIEETLSTVSYEMSGVLGGSMDLTLQKMTSSSPVQQIRQIRRLSIDLQ